MILQRVSQLGTEYQLFLSSFLDRDFHHPQLPHDFLSMLLRREQAAWLAVLVFVFR